jgi:AcrR family transcriptional regulator
MTPEDTRPLRADARRNRERLLEVARQTFAAGAPGDASLEGIARDAGVGVGTLYRHFPTREALVAAVFETELSALGDEAAGLLAEHPADVALRRWMDRYGAFVATKRGMAETLRDVLSSPAYEPGVTRRRLREALVMLLEAGARDGTLRDDVDATDVVLSMAGVFLATARLDDPAPAGRMLDLLVDGLRPRA